MKTFLQWRLYVGKMTLSLLFVLTLSYVFAQAPVNDNCGGAITIQVDAPFFSGNVEGATASPVVPCTGNLGVPGGNPNDDVWFKFTATKPYLVIQVDGSAQYNAVIQVFSGTCGNLAIMDCANEGKIGKTEKLPVNHYIPGNTYYFRVYDEGAGVPVTKDFKVRVYTPTPPGNDECANAKPVQVKTTCQYTTQNQEGATGSPEPNTCANGAAKNDDIWYSFVPKTKRVVITVHASHNYRAVLEVFDKCGGKAIGCTTSTKHNMFVKLAFDDLNPGQTYYFRVYNYYTPLSKSQTFELCVYDPAVPENDECVGAVNLNPSDTLRGDVNGSTPSQGYVSPCSGTPDDDVWYKFNAASTKETLELFPSPYFDGVLQVFDACNGKLIGCINDGGRNKKETMVLTGLKPGQDYFVRVFTTENVVSVTSSFRIARTSGPKPIANDECDNALSVPVTGKLLQSISGKMDNATQSMSPCNDSEEANDVWYKFTALSEKNTIRVVTKDSINPVFSLLEGCSATFASCIDNNEDGDAELLDTVLINNQIYYLRVYDANGSNHNGNFTITIEGEQTVQSITNSQDDSFKAFPIPVQDVLNLSFKDTKSRNLTLSDMQGNILITDTGILKDNYDLSEMSPGIYLLKIISEDKVYAIKIIKK